MSLKPETLMLVSDPSSLRQKRGSRKGAVTKIETHLETLKTKSLLSIDLEDLLVKAKQVEEAIAAYELIQQRLEAVEGPEESLAHSEAVESQRASMEAVKFSVGLRVKMVNLAVDIECLKDEINETINSASLSSVTAQSRVRDINSAYSELNRRARSRINDPEIKSLWTEMSALRSTLNNRIDTATTAPPAAPAATSSSSTSMVDVKSPAFNPAHMKVKPPSFKGNPLDWPQFYDLFTSAINDASYLSDRQKASLLIEAMSDPVAKTKAEDAAANSSYEEALAALVEVYGRPRVQFPLYMDSIFQQLQPIVYTRAGLLEAKSKLSKGYRGLQTCKACTAENLIAQHAVNLFTAETRKAWTAFNSGNKSPPHYDKLIDFLEKEMTDLDGDTRPPARLSKPQQSQKTTILTTRVAKVHTARANDAQHSPTCGYCKSEGHKIQQCSTFRGLDVETRRQQVATLKLCYNCLGTGHRLRECNSRGRYRECNGQHNTLLHLPSQSHDTSPESAAPQPAALVHLTTSSVITRPERSILCTAVVNVKSDKGQRAAILLFDEGAQISLLSSKLARTIGADLKPCDAIINGVGSTPLTCKHVTEVQIESLHLESPPSLHSSPASSSSHPSSTMSPRSSILVRCYVVEQQFSANPELDPLVVRRVLADHKQHKPWSDPELGRGRIDLLLSGGDTNRCHVGPVVFSHDKALKFTKTLFGWSIGGAVPSQGSLATVAKVSKTVETLDDPEQIFRLLWTSDMIPDDIPQLSPDDQQAMDHFHDTHCRLESGQYAVALPRRDSAPELGESRSTALRRFLSNERTLHRKNQWEQFNAVLQEYTDCSDMQSLYLLRT